MNFYSVYDCVFGSDNSETCEVFVCETDNNTWWYCCENSANWNESTIEPTEGCDLNELNDVDCFTLDCRGYSHFVSVMTEHLTPETVDRVSLSIDINSINSAFQNDNAQAELIQILKNCIDKIESKTFIHDKILDSNGNSVGDLYLDIENEEV